ncbi:MAG: AlbA family DNA-binding domain-containing protein [Bellilinea sp.]
MVFANKAFENLNEQDLHQLITNGISEGRSLEYKLILPGNADGEKKEFLADVSSFANASDGFIIYGMDEDHGLPTSLQGITGTDMDGEILRLENLVQNGITPRVPGISMRSVSLSTGAFALVVKVPKSWISPHMVAYGGSSRFYSRNSAGKYPLDVNEIRGAFLSTDAISNRIREFRLERINKVIVGDTPLPLPVGAKAILHLIPISNFLSLTSINLIFAEENFQRLTNFYTAEYSTPGNYRINMDGLVTNMVFNDGIPSYTQLFRNGGIEAVSHFLLAQGSKSELIIPSVPFEKAVMDTCFALLGFQKEAGVEPPIAIFLTLIGVKDYQMHLGTEYPQRMRSRGPIRLIDREVIQTPDVLVADYDSIVMHTLLRPIFDVVWNAAGWVQSINYDENGNWSDKRLGR